ncbi:MAG: hypothetical protein ACE5NM_05270 [Sedimentisphaerales bacterium]
MRLLGYLMITVGFLAGALAAVVDLESVRWGYFVSSIAVAAFGIVLVRIGRAQLGRAEGKLAANMQIIEASLSRIVENIGKLNAQKESINAYDMRGRIDELFAEDLAAFVQARESISQVYGLNAYADVMSYFAAGERYLNRVWSASADGYVDEVNTYLEKAQEQFVASLERIRHLKESTATMDACPERSQRDG